MEDFQKLFDKITSMDLRINCDSCLNEVKKYALHDLKMLWLKQNRKCVKLLFDLIKESYFCPLKYFNLFAFFITPAIYDNINYE